MNKTGETKFSNQVDWARFYLVRAGYLDSSVRGVWTLTNQGRATTIDEYSAAKIVRTVSAEMRKRSDVGEEPPEDDDVESRTTGAPSYKKRVLEVLRDLPPEGFERLAQRLLRESGFEKVEVTGRTGDGGIDGHGILQLNPFVSFRVVFQCKRYQGSLGPDKVRDFRGAIVGRADKGIIISTGAFTQAAIAEASRDGAEPIELVAGEDLVSLLEQLELGLRPKQTFELDERFFAEFRG